MDTGSIRRSSEHRGAALLDALVAVLILILVSEGLARLVHTHEQLVRAMSEWCQGMPTYRLVSPTDPLERAVGIPAALVPDNQVTAAGTPGSSSGSGGSQSFPYEVHILSRWRTLEPFAAGAQVKQTEAQP